MSDEAKARFTYSDLRRGIKYTFCCMKEAKVTASK